jgi:hypothetical protein
MSQTDIAINVGGALLLLSVALAVPMCLLAVSLYRDRELVARGVWLAVFVGVVLFVIGWLSPAQAADCTSGQLPYATPTICGIPPKTGNTPTEACNGVLPHLGGSVTVTGLSCNFTADCGGGPRTVTQVCTVAGTTPPSTTATSTATSVVCNGTCTLTIEHRITTPFFELTPNEGAQIAFAIVAVLVVGFAFRALIRTLNTDGTSLNQPGDRE